ncbi:hypothetical protein [Methylobacterium radiodurans]|uniref:Flagellar assembly protein FliH n=1 Tax=Methylobacterium radiodurans TaxID=2202828 RepID=A0A2U8VWW3_9HYPH|nr:hypothetical protein [Methylobacterium radiodurans]AWN37616.1 hypothetical protein DK427_19355 [Methylobacterium radiodurans]
MSAILASFLPDFSDALAAAPAAPLPDPTPAPWIPARVVRANRPEPEPRAAAQAAGATPEAADEPAADAAEERQRERADERAAEPALHHAPIQPAPLQPMTVPEALNALQALVGQPAAREMLEARFPARPAPQVPSWQAPSRDVPPRSPAEVIPLVPQAAADPFANPWSGLKRSAPAAAPEPVETPEERAARLEEAEARGRAEGHAQGLAEARAEAEAAMAAERESFAAQLAAERARWSESEAEQLAAGFAAALRALDADLTRRIGRLLVPVLTDALRRRAVDDLAQALAKLTADPNHAAIRVSGPEDLLAALSHRLGPQAAGIAFAPGAAPEVSVVADQTVIETQLAAWTRLLAAAAADPAADGAAES